MEKNMLCPNCGSENTEYIQGKISDCRLDLEVHPFLYRCLDCSEVFPLPDEVQGE